MIKLFVLIFLFRISDCWYQENVGTDFHVNFDFGKFVNNVYSSSVIGYNLQEQGEDILRPCNFSDYDCIRYILSVHSNCNPVFGTVSDPLKLKYSKFYIPFSNMTVTHKNLAYNGFKSAKVTEFYVNLANGNLVITFTGFNLSLTTKTSYYTYQRIAQESVTKEAPSSFELDSASFTATISKIPNLVLDTADIHANTNSNLKYVIGPSATATTDPEVLAEFVAFENNTVLLVKEALVFSSYYLFSTLLQTELCDFGVKSYANNIDLQGEIL